MPGRRGWVLGIAIAATLAPMHAHAHAQAQAQAQSHAQGLLPQTPWQSSASRPPVTPQAQQGRERPKPTADPTTLLVRFARAAGPAQRNSALRRAGVAGARSLRGSAFQVVSVPSADRRNALADLRRDGDVAEAQPNYVRRAAAMPDDNMVAKGRQGWISTLRLPAAWDRVKATHSQVVAVLDTGVDLDHPDLHPQLLPGRDVVNQDDRPADDDGHGTAVASIAAGRAGDGTGVAGVAWDASILPVKVLDAQGEGTDAWVIEGIAWAADHGADVINLSLGAPGRSPALDDAVAAARAKGAVVVAAAGNDGYPIPNYPAASPGATGVGATDWSGALTWYSNTGPWVDVAAPGHGIMGARPAPDGRGRWQPGDGTSFAAPIVSGLAALVVAQHPSWTPAEVEQQIARTALDAGPQGRDPYYGAGLVDALAATGGGAAPASAPPPADGDGTPDHARVLSISPGAPTSVEGRIDREGDEDWYAIDLPGDAEVAMTLYPTEQINVDRAQRVDGAIDIYDPSRRHVYRFDYGGMDTVESFDVLLPGGGRWYVRISSTASSRSPDRYTFGGTYVSTGPQTRPRFFDVQWHGSTSEAASTAIADVTGDGRPEVLMTTSTLAGDDEDWQLFVYQTGAEGELLDPEILDTGAREMWTSDGGTLNSNFMGVVTGDFTGDGRTDAAVAAGRWIAVFPQENGHLGAPKPIPGSQGADQLEVADVDGDGRMDLVAGMNSDGGAPQGEQLGVYAFLRRDGGWERRAVANWLGWGLAAGDVNGDGRTDVVGAGAASISIARQRPDGTFAVEVIQDDAGEGAAVADVTGDGRADVITTSGYATDTTRTLDVRAQTSSGGLAPPASTRAYYNGKAIETGDMDNDGRRDVVVFEDGCWCIEVFLARAGGTLVNDGYTTIGDHGNHYMPGALSLGDLDGDGALDVAAADTNADLVITHQWTSAYPRAEWIRDATPGDGAVGVASVATVTVRLGRALDPASASGARLEDASGAAVAATTAYDAAARTLTVKPTAALPAGAYVLQLGALRDTFGARAPDGLATRFTVGTPDATPPDTGIITAPSGITRAGNEPFTQAFASEPTVTFQCSFDTGAWTDCPPDKPAGGDMPNGSHTFRVRAVDGAGRADPTPATRSWTIDGFAAAPANDTREGAVTLTGASGSVTASSHRADLDFQVGEDDQGGRSIWFRWVAPADGTATFDTAGSGFDTLLAIFDDASPPVRRAADDDAAPGTLTSRARLTVRAGHTYLIGVDGFGGVSGAVTLAWSSAAAPDTTPPQTTITDGPRALVIEGTSDFSFAASEPGATFECSVNGSDYYPCDSPKSYTIWAGEYTLRVRATDGAGNTDPTPATWTWSVDRLAPTVTIPVNPGYSTTATTAVFAFEADEPGVTFECRLDRSAWAACPTPYSVTVTEPGPHELDVRGTDPAGNTGEYRRATWILLKDGTPLGDFDGDGRTDLVTGIPGKAIAGHPGAGAVLVLPGGAAAGSQLWSQDSPGVVDNAEDGDEFGGALAVGDFDADGYDDLAIGAPGENSAAGTVTVLRGSAGGLTATGSWRVSQATIGIAGNPGAGDRFGAALAAGRFDAGQSDDLAIGVPGEPVGSSAPGAGAVHVLPGGQAATARTFTRATPEVDGAVAPGTAFGAALAAGELGGDARDDLAIGAPGDGAGVVNVLLGGDAGLTVAGGSLWTQNTPGVPDAAEAGDRFGAALAIGALGGDSREDLAIGAPGESVGSIAGAGAVTVLLGTAGGPAAAGARLIHESVPNVAGAPQAGAGFGSALAITRPPTGTPWLAVSAPGKDIGTAADAGAIVALPVVSGSLSAVGSRSLSQSTAGVPDGAEAGDRWGAELSAAGADLLVGVPGEDGVTFADAGMLTVLPAAAAAGSTGWTLSSPGVAGVAAAGDRLGSLPR